MTPDPAIYEAAVEQAKAEYDALAPEAARLQTRLRQLRMLINNGSSLIGKAHMIPERFTYEAALVNKAGRRP